jgi:long-chain acyl-CoA synthetase
MTDSLFDRGRVVVDYRPTLLGTLRLITHGGAPCPIPVKQAMLDWLPQTEITEFYGFTEGGRVARIASADWRTHPGSAGRPVDGVDVRILDAHDEPLGPGEEGRIAVRPAGAPGSTITPTRRRRRVRGSATTAPSVTSAT